jgi:starch synthase
MKKMKVLFISQEITPYLPENEKSILCRTLPQSIQEKGNEIRTFMPRFGCINERRHQLHEVIRLSGMNLIINDTDHPLIIKVASIPQARMQVYFIDNEEYFHRKAVFTDKNEKAFKDNDERALFFCRGSLETVKKLGWAPDIIHCHGWMTGLVPLLLKKVYNDDPLFTDTKVVFSHYPSNLKGNVDKKITSKLKIGKVDDNDLKHFTTNPSFDSFNTIGLHYADSVITYGDTPAEVNAEILKLNKNHLHYNNSEFDASIFNDFYTKIFEESSVYAE